MNHYLFRSLSTGLIALAAFTANAQTVNTKHAAPTVAEQLRGAGTFSARTPTGVDLANRPAGAHLAQPIGQKNKQRKVQSRHRAVVRPETKKRRIQ